MEKSGLNSPLFNIGVVARVTGVPTATLHAWERRYGFPAAERTAGGHRLYSEKDIARLRWVKSQVDTGLAVSRAVVAVRAVEAEGRLFLPVEPNVELMSETRISSLNSTRDTLLSALTRHDLARADQLLGEQLAFYSPEDLTINIIGPVLNSIGEAWEQGHLTVSDEHLASNYLRHRLLMWLVTGPTPKPGNPLILACAPGEWHEGSLLMLAVLLRRQSWPVAYLGQNVPFNDLEAFSVMMIPRAIVMVAMSNKTARGLAAWPQWIKQVGGQPAVTFGGRAFVVQPELKGLVPGLYLGDTIPEGLQNLISMNNHGGN